MKYLFVILGFILLSTAVTLYFLWPSSNEVAPQNVALTVNGHQITKSQVDEQQRQGYRLLSAKDSVDSLVVKQLLLDEAERLGIDKENEFRQSLKKYYEQSLIRVLMDRTLETLPVNVSEAAIDKYLAGSAKIFTITRIPVEDGKARPDKKIQSRVLFDDLSESLRLVLASLQPGEEATQFETGSEIGLIRLDKIEPAEGSEAIGYDRKKIREALTDYQQSLEIDRWINGLRKKASIVIYKDGKNE